MTKNVLSLTSCRRKILWYFEAKKSIMYYPYHTQGNCSKPSAEQKFWCNITLTGVFSRDAIERNEWLQCHFVDYECDKGHELVESLTFPYETSRAIHVNIYLLGHAKKEEIHRQAENLRQSLREYFFAMQSWSTPAWAPAPSMNPLPQGHHAPCIARW